MRLLLAILAGMLASASATAAAAPAVCPVPVEKTHGIFEGHGGCNALDRYYAALRGGKPDWHAVHRCAVQERDDAVLMMLHANGYGVPRDIDRAILHACRVEGGEAETELRLERLQNIKAGRDKAPFDLCDDVMSAMMTGLCAGIVEEADSAKRNAALAGFAAAFTPAQRALFATLRKATDEFAEDVGGLETDMSGTGHVALSIGAQAEVRDELVADLRASEAGRLPSGTDAAFTAADKALNEVYRKVMALAADAEGGLGGTVTKSGIRTTQRAWIAYRDAWTAFGRARYPAVPAAAWKARLTERRSAQLREWLR